MNKNHNKNRKSEKGVTFIEVLIGVGIVSMVTVSVYMALAGVIRTASDAKQRTGAIALAHEKMEIMRNLPYEEIGVVGGIVSGPIPASETINRNGFGYQVETEVRYIDDPFDGISPDDPVGNDYKQAQVDVIWQNAGADKSVSFFSKFVPNGIETDVGGGTLSLNTVTSEGDLVPNVEIVIDSVNDSPEINQATSTDGTGNLTLPGVPSQLYRLYASKSGYESLQTYPSPPDSPFNPIKKDLFVSEGDLNPFTFVIEQTAELTIVASDVVSGDPVENVEFQLEGGRKIGTDPDGTGPDTFNFSDTSSTDVDGSINYSDLSPGGYEVLNYNSLGNSNYELAGSDVTGSTFQLDANASKTVNYIFAHKETNSLLVIAADSTDGSAIEGASVHLFGGSIDQTVTTGADGRAFFPINTDPITVIDADDYNLEITADGYQQHSSTVYISDLVSKDIELTPN